MLRRVIECASDPGDLVVDFFAGSGTTAIAAERTNRMWILCDKSQIAIDVIKMRLEGITHKKYHVEQL